MKSINKLSLVKTMNKPSLMKGIDSIKNVKSINIIYPLKTKIEHVMSTCVLRRPIVFHRVRCSICVRCSILILLIKTVRCIIVRFTVYKYSADLGCRAFSRVVLRAARMLGLWIRIPPEAWIVCLL